MKLDFPQLKGRRFVLPWLPFWIGVEKSTVLGRDGSKYLTRWIVYLGAINLRLHKFWRGDDDRASHTHPWWFITIPFRPYRERVYVQGEHWETRVVPAWRPSFRRRDFEHIVVGAVRVNVDRFANGATIRAWTHDPRHFYTFVIAGPKSNAWGFYKPDGTFIPWRQYK